MGFHGAHATVEIVDTTSKVAEKVGTARDVARVAKAISGTEAFRKYNWLKGVPVKNASKNFRGMVVSARWRAVFDFSEKFLEKTKKVSAVAENVVLVAGMAMNLAKAAPEIERILDSKEDWASKAAKLGPQATSIMSRTLYELVAGPVRTLASSMIVEGYCDVGDVIRGQAVGACHKQVKYAIAQIDAQVSQFTDGNNLYLLIDTKVNPVISSVLGF